MIEIHRREVAKEVLKFVESRRHSFGRFTISRGNEPDLFAACYVVQILTLLDQRDWLTSREKGAIIDHLQDCQDESGFFTTSVVAGLDSNRAEINLLLNTQMATSSLALLGAWPVRNLSYLDRLSTSGGVRAWFDRRRCAELTTGNSWDESISVMAVGGLLLLNSWRRGESPADSVPLNEFFGCLDRLRNRWTGMWGTGAGIKNRIVNLIRGTPLNLLTKGMGTSFHMVDIYAAVGKRQHRADRLAENVLRAQHRDGLFNTEEGGSQCHDLDGVSILANLTTQVQPERRQRIRIAFERTLRAFLAYRLQGSDGGFRNFAGSVGYQKGDTRLFVRPRDSDLFSTWFRLATIALIDASTNPGRDHGWVFPLEGFLHLDPEVRATSDR